MPDTSQEFNVVAYFPDESEFNRRANVSVNGKGIMSGDIQYYIP